MVIKGGSVAGGARLAKHLQNTDSNERMEVLELRGVAATDLRGALQEMEEAATACPNCRKPFYHASINTRAGERLSDPQRYQAIDRLEKELGLTGQPRAVVVHQKKGREHCHVVWSRIDLAKLRTISDSHNYRKHELVARELERAFGHERVQGAHIEREGRARPERTPSHAEMQQGARTGITPQAARAHITNLWRQSDTGAAFAKGLEDSGWTLARGDRRDFVAVDPRGGVHSLARRIDGAKVADVRARLVDIDISALPSVAEAKAMQRARVRQEGARMRPPASGQRPAPRPALVVTSAMRRTLATRTRRAGRLARTIAASHHFTSSLHGASDDAIRIPVNSPAALPIPRSAAPVNPRTEPERGSNPRTDCAATWIIPAPSIGAISHAPSLPVHRLSPCRP